MRRAELDLIFDAGEGDDAAFAALARLHARMVESALRNRWAVGLEDDDLRQAALLALHKAAVTYAPGEIPFSAFAYLVMRRAVDSAVKMGTALRHRPLAEARLEESLGDGTLGGVIPMCGPDAHDQLVMREDIDAIAALLPALSSLERTAVLGRINGLSYDEAGDRKAIDNALQRARRKIRAVLAA